MKQSIKVFSLILVQAMLLESAAFAAPTVPALSVDVFAVQTKLPFNLSPSIASLEDAWTSSVQDPSRKTQAVYLIQDAHTNPSAQKNIAAAIGAILEHEPNIDQVFSEAGEGDYSLNYLKSAASKAERTEVGLSFLNKGALQGSEYLSLTSDKDFRLTGVEDIKLYEKALSVYSGMKTKRESFETRFAQIERTLKVLEDRHHSDEAKEFIANQLRYDRGELPATAYAGFLHRAAKKNHIDKKTYEAVAGLVSLGAMESAIDFKKVGEEERAALNSLPDEVQKELGSKKPAKLGQDSEAVMGYFTALEERSKVTGPELTKYLTYLKKYRKLDPHALLNQINALESAVASKIAQTPEEASLLTVRRALDHLNKLFDLKLTAEEFRQIQTDSPLHDLKRLAGYLNGLVMKDGLDPAIALFIEKDYEASFREAMNFYELAYLRDEAFIEHMKKQGFEKAVLITGGFHTPHLKELLKKEGISYYSLIPQVTHETDQARYERILLEGNKFVASLVTKPAALSAASAPVLAEIPHASIGARLGLATPLIQVALGARGARMAAHKGKKQVRDSNAEWHAQLDADRSRQIAHEKAETIKNIQQFLENKAAWHAREDAVRDQRMTRENARNQGARMAQSVPVGTSGAQVDRKTLLNRIVKARRLVAKRFKSGRLTESQDRSITHALWVLWQAETAKHFDEGQVKISSLASSLQMKDTKERAAIVRGIQALAYLINMDGEDQKQATWQTSLFYEAIGRNEVDLKALKRDLFGARMAQSEEAGPAVSPRTLQILRNFEIAVGGDDGAKREYQLSPKGDALIYADAAGRPHALDLRTGYRFNDLDSDDVKGLKFTPEGRHLIVLFRSDRPARFIDLDSHKSTDVDLRSPKFIRFSPQGHYLITQLRDDSWMIYRYENPDHIVLDSDLVELVRTSGAGKVNYVVFSEDEKILSFYSSHKIVNFYLPTDIKPQRLPDDGPYSDNARLWFHIGDTPQLRGALNVEQRTLWIGDPARRLRAAFFMPGTDQPVWVDTQARLQTFSHPVSPKLTDNVPYSMTGNPVWSAQAVNDQAVFVLYDVDKKKGKSSGLINIANRTEVELPTEGVIVNSRIFHQTGLVYVRASDSGSGIYNLQGRQVISIKATDSTQVDSALGDTLILVNDGWPTLYLTDGKGNIITDSKKAGARMAADMHQMIHRLVQKGVLKGQQITDAKEGLARALEQRPTLREFTARRQLLIDSIRRHLITEIKRVGQASATPEDYTLKIQGKEYMIDTAGSVLEADGRTVEDVTATLDQLEALLEHIPAIIARLQKDFGGPTKPLITRLAKNGVLKGQQIKDAEADLASALEQVRTMTEFTTRKKMLIDSIRGHLITEIKRVGQTSATPEDYTLKIQGKEYTIDTAGSVLVANGRTVENVMATLDQLEALLDFIHLNTAALQQKLAGKPFGREQNGARMATMIGSLTALKDLFAYLKDESAQDVIQEKIEQLNALKAAIEASEPEQNLVSIQKTVAEIEASLLTMMGRDLLNWLEAAHGAVKVAASTPSVWAFLVNQINPIAPAQKIPVMIEIYLRLKIIKLLELQYDFSHKLMQINLDGQEYTLSTAQDRMFESLVSADALTITPIQPPTGLKQPAQDSATLVAIYKAVADKTRAIILESIGARMAELSDRFRDAFRARIEARISERNTEHLITRQHLIEILTWTNTVDRGIALNIAFNLPDKKILFGYLADLGPLAAPAIDHLASQEILASNDAHAQREAFDVLGKIGPAAIPALLRIAHQSNVWLKDVQQTLVVIGPDPALLDSVGASANTPAVNTMILDAIAQMDPAKAVAAVPALIRVLKAPPLREYELNAQLKRSAVLALIAIGEAGQNISKAAPALIERLVQERQPLPHADGFNLIRRAEAITALAFVGRRAGKIAVREMRLQLRDSKWLANSNPNWFQIELATIRAFNKIDPNTRSRRSIKRLADYLDPGIGWPQAIRIAGEFSGPTAEKYLMPKLIEIVLADIPHEIRDEAMQAIYKIDGGTETLMRLLLTPDPAIEPFKKEAILRFIQTHPSDAKGARMAELDKRLDQIAALERQYPSSVAGYALLLRMYREKLTTLQKGASTQLAAVEQYEAELTEAMRVVLVGLIGHNAPAAESRGFYEEELRSLKTGLERIDLMIRNITDAESDIQKVTTYALQAIRSGRIEDRFQALHEDLVALANNARTVMAVRRLPEAINQRIIAELGKYIGADDGKYAGFVYDIEKKGGIDPYRFAVSHGKLGYRGLDEKRTDNYWPEYDFRGTYGAAKLFDMLHAAKDEWEDRLGEPGAGARMAKPFARTAEKAELKRIPDGMLDFAVRTIMKKVGAGRDRQALFLPVAAFADERFTRFPYDLYMFRVDVTSPATDNLRLGVTFPDGTTLERAVTKDEYDAIQADHRLSVAASDIGSVVDALNESWRTTRGQLQLTAGSLEAVLNHDALVDLADLLEGSSADGRLVNLAAFAAFINRSARQSDTGVLASTHIEYWISKGQLRLLKSQVKNDPRATVMLAELIKSLNVGVPPVSGDRVSIRFGAAGKNRRALNTNFAMLPAARGQLLDFAGTINIGHTVTAGLYEECHPYDPDPNYSITPDILRLASYRGLKLSAEEWLARIRSGKYGLKEGFAPLQVGNVLASWAQAIRATSSSA